MLQYLKEDKQVPLFLLGCLGVALFFTPFFRGLFFEKEVYFFTMIFCIIALLFSIYKTVRKEKMSTRSFIYYFALGVALLYLFSIIGAVSQQKAIVETLKVSMYFIIFVLIERNVNNKSKITFMNYVFIASGTIATIIGFGTAFGSFSYKDAILDGRISSTFQYYNTFGAYLAGVIFLIAGQIAQSEGIKKNIHNGLGYLSFMGLIFSYSRGAWLLFLIVGFIMLLLLKQKGFKNVITSFIYIIISIGISINFIYKSIAVPNAAQGWSWLVMGTILSVVIGVLIDKFFGNAAVFQIPKKKFLIFLTSIILICIVGFSSGILTRALPENLGQRIQGVSLKTFTVVERNVFYNDAFKIIKEHPILGVGGGGWQVLYPSYKSYNYTSTQVHNYLIQTWVEIGIIGVILLIGFYLSTVWAGYKILRDSEESAYDHKVAILMAVLVLIAHSMIDFDMSLGAYGIFVWSLLGLVAAMEKKASVSSSIINTRIPNFVFGVFVLLIGFAAGSFSLARDYSNQAMKLLQEQKFDQVEDYFAKAVQYNPFMSSYRFDLGNLQFQKGYQLQSEENMKIGIENTGLAVSMDDRDSRMLTNGIMFHLRRGKIEEGIQLLEKMQKNDPLEDKTYNDSIKVYYNVAVTFLKNQKNAEAKKYLEKVLEMNDIVNQKNKELRKLQDVLLKDVHDAPPDYLEKAFKLHLQPDSLQFVKDSEQLVKALN